MGHIQRDGKPPRVLSCVIVALEGTKMAKSVTDTRICDCCIKDYVPTDRSEHENCNDH